MFLVVSSCFLLTASVASATSLPSCTGAEKPTCNYGTLGAPFWVVSVTADSCGITATKSNALCYVPSECKEDEEIACGLDAADSKPTAAGSYCAKGAYVCRKKPVDDPKLPTCTYEEVPVCDHGISGTPFYLSVAAKELCTDGKIASKCGKVSKCSTNEKLVCTYPRKDNALAEAGKPCKDLYGVKSTGLKCVKSDYDVESESAESEVDDDEYTKPVCPLTEVLTCPNGEVRFEGLGVTCEYKGENYAPKCKPIVPCKKCPGEEVLLCGDKVFVEEEGLLPMCKFIYAPPKCGTKPSTVETCTGVPKTYDPEVCGVLPDAIIKGEDKLYAGDPESPLQNNYADNLAEFETAEKKTFEASTKNLTAGAQTVKVTFSALLALSILFVAYL